MDGSNLQYLSTAENLVNYPSEKTWHSGGRSVRTTLRTPTKCKLMPVSGYFGGKGYGHLRLVKQRQLLKESIKTKTESGKCFCIRVVLSIKLKLIVMSTNLEYRDNERQRKRESRATERSSTRKGARERETKNKGRHFCWRNNMKFCSGGMLAGRWKWATVKKKVNKKTDDASSIKREPGRF